jgi:hypothetical protein
MHQTCTSCIWYSTHFLLPVSLLFFYTLFEGYVWCTSTSLSLWDVSFFLANILYHLCWLIFCLVVYMYMYKCSLVNLFRGIQLMVLVHILCWFVPYTIWQFLLRDDHVPFLPRESGQLTTFRAVAMLNWIFSFIDFYLLLACQKETYLLNKANVTNVSVHALVNVVEPR